MCDRIAGDILIVGTLLQAKLPLAIVKAYLATIPFYGLFIWMDKGIILACAPRGHHGRVLIQSSRWTDDLWQVGHVILIGQSRFVYLILWDLVVALTLRARESLLDASLTAGRESSRWAERLLDRILFVNVDLVWFHLFCLFCFRIFKWWNIKKN